MNAPRKSSPLAVGLEIPCPVLQSLTDTSHPQTKSPALPKVSRMEPIHEENIEPEEDRCQPCSQASGTIEEHSHQPQDEKSEATLDYIAIIREGIRRQGERLQQEEAEKQDLSSSESEKVDFHIKVVKKRPAPLHLGSKSKSRFSSIKSNAKHRFFWIRFPKAKALTMIPSSRSKSGQKIEARPKIKSTNRASLCSSPAKEREDIAEAYNPFETSEEFEEEGEETGLLSQRSPTSSPAYSFHAFHFYTPMVQPKSKRTNEYRPKKSRFSGFKSAASRFRFHAGNVLSMRRRGWRGWSRLD